MEKITDVKVKNVLEATEIVKEFFKKVKGAEIKVGSRELLDWLDFGVISAAPLGKRYLDSGFSKDKKAQLIGYKVICELKENLFSEKKERYDVTVNIKGEVASVERIENG